MRRLEYLREENWYGSFYELGIELGPYGGDALATRALGLLWRQPELTGPWRERSGFGSKPDEASLSQEQAPLYGCLTLEAGTQVGCMSYLVRVAGEADWLDLSIPMGMLELEFSVSYPLDRTTNPWLVKLDRLLAQIAASLYENTKFRLALLGEEASGTNSETELTAADCEQGGFLVPEPLWRKLSPRRVPETVRGGLVYVPFIGPHIEYDG